MANQNGSISRIFSQNISKLNDIFEKLASGKRINRAKDDAAGLSISKQLDASIATLTQGSRNASDSQSAIQIAESALGKLGDIGTRQKELAIQASNGTLSDGQRQALQSEYNQLSQEAERIVNTTEFNGRKLLDSEQFTSQVGNTGSESSQIRVQGVNAAAIISPSASQNIGTQAGAQTALASLDSLIKNVSEARGALGAVSTRLSAAAENNATRVESEQAARSRIEDVDYAEEVANKTAANIRAQAGPALMAQANNLNASVVQRLLS